MQGIAVVVLDEVVLYAIDSEFALVDTVGKAADSGTKVRRCLAVEVGIGLHIVEAKHYVLELAVAIGSHDADDAAAKVGDAYLHAVLVGEGVEGSWLTIDGIDELFWVKARSCKIDLLCLLGSSA